MNRMPPYQYILQWNVGGLRSHLPEFKQYMQKNSPLIAAIQETHLWATDHLNYDIPGYTLYRNDVNQQYRQGGVALYISNSLPQRETVFTSSLNLVAATVSLFNREMLVVSVYLPPNSPVVTQRSVSTMFQQMPENCIMLGDFNAHNPLWDSQRLSPRGKIMETELNRKSFVCLNNGSPTFRSRSYHTASAIDLSIASPRIAPLLEWTATSDPIFSDHFPLHICLTCASPLLPSPTIKKWKTENANWEAFNENINQLAPYDLTQTILNFTNAISTSAEETIETKNIKIGPPNLGKNPVWWNWKCQRAKAIRRRAYRNFQRCICDRHAELYTAARKECAETIFREKKEAWREYASKCNRFTPLGEMWDQVRVLTSRRATGAFPQFCVQNTFVTDPLAVANVFADHFASISSTSIYPAGVNQRLTDGTETLVFGSDNSEPYNAPFTLCELKLSLTQTGNKSSVGPDGLPYSFFTNLNELNLSTLLIAFNNLWANHSFPAEWLDYHTYS